MKKQSKLLLLAICATFFLSGCGSVKKEIGMGRNSPDEFLVVKRAPLTLPPEYALRPPAEKTDVKDEIVIKSTRSKARDALFGGYKEVEAKGSADNMLLAKMNVEAANADIRRQIEEDNGYIYIKNQSVIEKLTSAKPKEAVYNKMPGSTVDAKAEMRRIKKNLSEGKPVNEGDVPVIEKKLGTLDKLF